MPINTLACDGNTYSLRVLRASLNSCPHRMRWKPAHLLTLIHILPTFKRGKMSVCLPGPQGKMPLWQFTGKLALFHMLKRDVQLFQDFIMTLSVGLQDLVVLINLITRKAVLWSFIKKSGSRPKTALVVNLISLWILIRWCNIRPAEVVVIDFPKSREHKPH